MAVNKINYNNKTLIDLRTDTISPYAVLQGFTFHDSTGNMREGQIVNKGISTLHLNSVSGVNIPEGYYEKNSSVQVQYPETIKEENIREGITILGVTGSLVEKKSTDVHIEVEPHSQTISPSDAKYADNGYNSFETLTVDAAPGFQLGTIGMSKNDWLDLATYGLKIISPGYYLNEGLKNVNLVNNSNDPNIAVKSSGTLIYAMNKGQPFYVEDLIVLRTLEDNVQVTLYITGKGKAVQWTNTTESKDTSELSEETHSVSYTYEHRGSYTISIVDYDPEEGDPIPDDERYFSLGYYVFDTSSSTKVYTAYSLIGNTYTFSSNDISNFAECTESDNLGTTIIPKTFQPDSIVKVQNVELKKIVLTSQVKEILPFSLASNTTDLWFRSMHIQLGANTLIHPKAFYIEDIDNPSSMPPIEISIDVANKTQPYIAKWLENGNKYTPFADFIRTFDNEGTISYYCDHFIFINSSHVTEYQEAFSAEGFPWSTYIGVFPEQQRILGPVYGFTNIQLPVPPITAAITTTPSSSQQTINPASTDIGIESVVVEPIPSIIFGGSGSTAVTLPAEITSISDILLAFNSTNLTMLRYSALVMDVSALSLGVNNVIIYPADYDGNTGIFRFSGYDPNFGGGTNVIASFQYDSTNNTVQFIACEMNGTDTSSYIPSVNWKFNVVIYDDGN